MAIYYALGNALVSNNELREKAADGVLKKFFSKKVDRIDFSHGLVTQKTLLRSFTLEPQLKPIGFEPIGIGRPLCVQIRHVYNGDKARGFWGDKDMLVASAMKSVAAYEGAPRAINFMVKKAPSNRNFRSIAATDKGTPLVCYAGSLTQHSSVVTVEVVFAGFNKEAFDAIAQAFSSAAGIPIFAPASGYLAIAGLVTKLLGDVVKSLSSGTPYLKETEEITFITPGSIEAAAGFCLLINDNVRKRVLDEYKVNGAGTLVRIDDEKKIYDGPEPYVVISIDGREVDDFKEFAPTAASAAVLDKFYNVNEGGSRPLGVLVEGLKLYSDIRFREKAETIAGKLGKITDQTSPEYQKLLTEFNANVANIGNEVLKPKI